MTEIGKLVAVLFYSGDVVDASELCKNFGIDPGRITTDGKGSSQPIAPNDNPSNKAKNRRVEFIKL